MNTVGIILTSVFKEVVRDKNTSVQVVTWCNYALLIMYYVVYLVLGPFQESRYTRG